MGHAVYEKTLRSMSKECLNKELESLGKMRYLCPRYSDEVRRKTALILNHMGR